MKKKKNWMSESEFNITREEDYEFRDPSLEIEAFSLYIGGYRNSIDLLLAVLESNRTLLFPLTFLVVHYIELIIKDMNLQYGTGRGVFTLKGLGIDNHNILKLLNDSVDEFIDYGIKKDDIVRFESLIEYFVDLGTNSQISESMRYPVNRDNVMIINSKLINDLNSFDIYMYMENVKSLMALSDEIFSGYNIKAFLVSMRHLKKLIELTKNKEYLLMYNDLVREIRESLVEEGS